MATVLNGGPRANPPRVFTYSQKPCEGKAMRDSGSAAEEVRTRIQELRQEIANLLKLDREQRLSRQSQVPWDAQKQHEARVARMDEIKKELVKLGRGLE
jgi:hypothetical protein